MLWVPRFNDLCPRANEIPETVTLAAIKSHSKISVSRRTESCTAEGVEAVDKYKCPGEVFPSLGDGVPHLIQA